jgi:hypothetical protein
VLVLVGCGDELLFRSRWCWKSRFKGFPIVRLVIWVVGIGTVVLSCCWCYCGPVLLLLLNVSEVVVVVVVLHHRHERFVGGWDKLVYQSRARSLGHSSLARLQKWWTSFTHLRRYYNTVYRLFHHRTSDDQSGHANERPPRVNDRVAGCCHHKNTTRWLYFGDTIGTTERQLGGKPASSTVEGNTIPSDTNFGIFMLHEYVDGGSTYTSGTYATNTTYLRMYVCSTVRQSRPFPIQRAHRSQKFRWRMDSSPT